MLQEAADELNAGDAHCLVLARVLGRIAVTYAQGYVLAVDGDDALVADGRAVGVARQIVEHSAGPGQRCLGIHHPGLGPQALHALAALAWIGPIAPEQPVYLIRLQRRSELARA